MPVATTATESTIEATDGTMPTATTATEPTIEAMDGTMPVATTATEPTIEATDGTMPMATTATEPTIGATDRTMPVATAAIETTETTGIFDISEIISIKIKELRTNSDSIVNNISCNEPPNCSTRKSNRFAIESNSLNCNKNARLRGSATWKNFLFIIYVREKRSKQNIYNTVLIIVCFETFF